MKSQRTNPSHFPPVITPERRIPWLEPLENRLLFSTYTVTTLGDALGTITPNGAGKFNATTLRAAITAANSSAGADTINFAAAVTGTLHLGKALPSICNSLTIRGPGTTKLAIRRSASSNTDFSIFRVGQGSVASISNLTAVAGTGTPIVVDPERGGTATFGGGIYNEGRLTLADVDILDNDAEHFGGGVFNLGRIDLTNCTIARNVAQWYSGGGIANSGSMTITTCTIADNSTLGDLGGGIYNVDGALSVTNSVVSGNSAISPGVGVGGGIYTNSQIPLAISNSTIINNEAEAGAGIFSHGALVIHSSAILRNVNTGEFTGGGGIFSNDGELTMWNSSIVGNQANGGGGGLSSDGSLLVRNCSFFGNFSKSSGGIDYSNDARVFNSYVVGNTDFAGKSNDVNGYNPLNTANSLFGVTTGPHGITNGKNGNKVGVTPAQLKLGPLADNGGPTQTMALLPGSIAINAGSNAKALDADGKPLATDQRGFARIVGGTVDVGAFEVQSPIVTGKGSVAGVVFKDLNGNRVQDANESGVKGWLVWADLNKDGKLNYNEPRTVSNAAGKYTLTNVPARYQLVRLEHRANWQQTIPRGGGAHGPTILTDKLITGWHFGVKPILG